MAFSDTLQGMRESNRSARLREESDPRVAVQTIQTILKEAVALRAASSSLNSGVRNELTNIRNDITNNNIKSDDVTKSSLKKYSQLIDKVLDLDKKKAPESNYLADQTKEKVESIFSSIKDAIPNADNIIGAMISANPIFGYTAKIFTGMIRTAQENKRNKLEEQQRQLEIIQDQLEIIEDQRENIDLERANINDSAACGFDCDDNEVLEDILDDIRNEMQRLNAVWDSPELEMDDDERYQMTLERMADGQEDTADLLERILKEDIQANDALMNLEQQREYAERENALEKHNLGPKTVVNNNKEMTSSLLDMIGVGLAAIGLRGGLIAGLAGGIIVALGGVLKMILSPITLLLKGIKLIGRVVTKSFNLVVNFAKKSFEFVSAIAKKSSSLAGNIAKKSSRLLGFLKFTGILTLITTLFEFFDGFFSASRILGKEVTTIGERINVGIASVIESLLFIPNWIAGLFGKEFLPEDEDEAIKKIHGGVETFFNRVGYYVALIVEWYNKIGESIGIMLHKTVTFISDIGAWLHKSFTETLPNIGVAIGNKIYDLQTKIGAFVGTLVNNTVDTIKGIFTAILDKFTDAVTAIRDKIFGFFNSGKDFFSDAYSSITEGVTGVASNIAGATTSMFGRDAEQLESATGQFTRQVELYSSVNGVAQREPVMLQQLDIGVGPMSRESRLERAMNNIENIDRQQSTTNNNVVVAPVTNASSTNVNNTTIRAGSMSVDNREPAFRRYSANSSRLAY